MSTIYDIAQKTGYSASTVSKALNNYSNISEKAKNKINEVAKELNYIPNAGARSLMTRKTFLIGLLVYEDNYKAILHPHFAGILDSFKNYVETKGYDVLFVNSKHDGRNHTYYEHCRYRSVDGVFISIGDIQIEEQKIQIDELVKSEIPKVSVESVYDNTTTILSDNYNGAKKAMEYLGFLGHKNIAYVDVVLSGATGEARRKAYGDYMNQNGTEFSENSIYYSKGFVIKDGKDVANEILKRGFSNLPTAVFCLCDEIAIGLIEAFKNNGVRVPEDVSVIGFDDIQAAEYTQLTTIRQDRDSIGIQAGKNLIEAIEGESKAEIVLVETELVIRSTCKSIK